MSLVRTLTRGVVRDLTRTLYSTSAAAIAASGAATLASGETDALAFDFTDDFYQASTGLYGSAYVLDSGTPANDYDSHPYGLLTYTSPSTKYCLQADGTTYKLGAHNLYLNSASPANQSITVVSGATYAVTITGSVSVTASGAATGTWTAGTTTFTAATTTLTLGSTSGSGTVHVRRTPSVDTYLPTTSAARYALPYEWDTSGNLRGIRVEEAATNLFTNNTTLDNATPWPISRASMTANATTAPDGTTTADLLVTTSGQTSGTIHQVVSVTATTKYVIWTFAKKQSSFDDLAFIVNGNLHARINLTTGATSTVAQLNSWTVDNFFYESVGDGWYICGIACTAGTTGSVQVRPCCFEETGDGTNGVYFWAPQMCTGTAITSPIITYGATATRAADNISLATSAFPYSATAGTVYALFSGLTTAAGTVANLSDGGNTERILVQTTGSFGYYVVDGAATQAQISFGALSANTDRKVAVAWAANDFASSVDGGAASTDASGTLPTITTLSIGTTNGASPMSGHIKKLMYLPRRASNAELQTLTT